MHLGLLRCLTNPDTWGWRNPSKSRIPDATSRVCLVCRRSSASAHDSLESEMSEKSDLHLLCFWVGKLLHLRSWRHLLWQRQPVQIGWWCLETQIVHNSSSFCPIYCIKLEDILFSVWAIAWWPMCVRIIWTLLPSLTTFGSPRLHHKRR